MPRFVFPLDGVLRQRKHVEEQRQRELAVLQADWVALEGQLREMDRQVQETTADVRENRLVGTLDLAYLTAHRRYSAAMQRRAVGIAEQMTALKTRIDAARRALIEAAKQRKIIEKLRENRKERWAGELARRESAEIDEIGAQIGFRNITQAMQELATQQDGAET